MDIKQCGCGYDFYSRKVIPWLDLKEDSKSELITAETNPHDGYHPATGFLITIVLAVFVLILYIGIKSGGKKIPLQEFSGERNMAYESLPAKTDLEVVSYELSDGQYDTRYVVGIVKNNSDKKYKYVQIEINYYNYLGEQIGSTMDNVNNLEPKGTWRFSASIDKSIDSVKIMEVSGW